MKKIPLTQGKYALVDDWNYDWLNQWKWYAENKDNYYFYARRQLKRNSKTKKQKSILMHRLILCAKKGQITDHINHNGLNNQEHNLRICNKAQNKMNSKKHLILSSEYKGVCWHKATQKWMARITVNKKRIQLGLYEKEIYAAKAYNMAAKKYYGKFARLNPSKKNATNNSK